jgi:hypothetical protein
VRAAACAAGTAEGVLEGRGGSVVRFAADFAAEFAGEFAVGVMGAPVSRACGWVVAPGEVIVGVAAW